MGEPLLHQKTQLDASSGYGDEMLALLSEDQQPGALVLPLLPLPGMQCLHLSHRQLSSRFGPFDLGQVSSPLRAFVFSSLKWRHEY